MERRIYVVAVALVMCFVGLTLCPPATGQDIPQQNAFTMAFAIRAGIRFRP